MLSSKEAIQITNMSMERIYQETLVDIEEQIKDCVSNGYNEFVYSVSKKSHVSDIIEHLKIARIQSERDWKILSCRIQSNLH